MKKFFAVLLAVALMGFAGAAFADDAGHGGHLSSGTMSVVVPSTVAESLDATVLSSDCVSGDVTTPTVEGKKTLALGWLKNLTPGKKYVVAVNLTGLTSQIVAGTVKVYDLLRTTDVTVAAEGHVAGKIYDANLKETTDTDAAKYAVFTAAVVESQLYAAGTELTGSPVSNKGSGGCNGGFAGLAALALGALALRRKAR
ncbi:MAG: SYNERG-CTERM sorting domain-containing protein [Fretibacterium sp.]|nr:SYNERG-CTERM sorting domain-containing protein [Fretibacterium sp.]